MGQFFIIMLRAVSPVIPVQVGGAGGFGISRTLHFRFLLDSEKPGAVERGARFTPEW